MNFDFSLGPFFFSLLSQCIIYPRGRSVRIKTDLLSVEALLEADPSEL
jgi:hypothetical protein